MKELKHKIPDELIEKIARSYLPGEDAGEDLPQQDLELVFDQVGAEIARERKHQDAANGVQGVKKDPPRGYHVDVLRQFGDLVIVRQILDRHL